MILLSRKGENIYKRKDGRWEGRYIKGHNDTKKAIYGYVYAYSYKEVKEKLNTAKSNLPFEKTTDINKSNENYDYWLLIWLCFNNHRQRLIKTRQAI